MTEISAVVSRSRRSISSRRWCFSPELMRCARLRRFRPNRIGSLPASGGASASRAASSKPAESSTTTAETEASATPPSSAPIHGATCVLHPEVVVPAARAPRPGSPHARSHNGQKEKDFSYEPRVGGTSPGGWYSLRAGHRRCSDQAGEFIDGRSEPPGVIPLPKTRRNDVTDDSSCLRIRDLAFQPVADLDPHPSVRDRHDDENAIVLVGFADPPLLKQPNRCLLDRSPRERG